MARREKKRIHKNEIKKREGNKKCRVLIPFFILFFFLFILIMCVVGFNFLWQCLFSYFNGIDHCILLHTGNFLSLICSACLLPSADGNVIFIQYKTRKNRNRTKNNVPLDSAYSFSFFLLLFKNCLYRCRIRSTPKAGCDISVCSFFYSIISLIIFYLLFSSLLLVSFGLKQCMHIFFSLSRVVTVYRKCQSDPENILWCNGIFYKSLWATYTYVNQCHNDGYGTFF